MTILAYLGDPEIIFAFCRMTKICKVTKINNESRNPKLICVFIGKHGTLLSSLKRVWPKVLENRGDKIWPNIVGTLRFC